MPGTRSPAGPCHEELVAGPRATEVLWNKTSKKQLQAGLGRIVTFEVAGAKPPALLIFVVLGYNLIHAARCCFLARPDHEFAELIVDVLVRGRRPERSHLRAAISRPEAIGKQRALSAKG